MTRLKFAKLALAALLSLPLTAAAARADDQPPLSPAQTALFIANQLKTIDHPVVLAYAFRHEGPDSYSDQVKLSVSEVHPDGSKDMTVDFLTGTHHEAFDGIKDFNGNPVLMYFLEYDVKQMNKATGGSTLYFRNRIREAFFDGAEMHPVKVTLNGRESDGTEIIIHPYAKAAEPQMTPYLGKSYHFILSDAVPGTLYEIRSELPQSEQGPAVTESVTLTGEQK